MLATASDARAVDITTCSATVPAREVWLLQANLVCPVDTAIILESGATLDLAGHTLTLEHGHLRRRIVAPADRRERRDRRFLRSHSRFALLSRNLRAANVTVVDCGDTAIGTWGICALD